MIPKSVKRFSEKIILKQKDKARREFEERHRALGRADMLRACNRGLPS